MEAEIVVLDRLLQENSVVKCPIIQRKFTWGKEQVKQYVEDIISQGNNRKATQYFIGTMIVKYEEGINVEGISQIVLYEGQQRWVVTSLIYFGLYLFYRTHPEVKPTDLEDCELLLKYVYNNKDKSKLKLSLNPQDQTDYQKILDEKFEENNSHMYKMFRIIQKKINKTNHLSLLRGLRKLKVILTRLNGDDNADLIFDTVNTRGQPLDFIDKLRNLCLLNLEPELQKETYQNKWVPFYDKFTQYHFDSLKPSWVKGLGILENMSRSERLSPKSVINWLRSRNPLEAMDLVIKYNDILTRMIETKGKYQRKSIQLLHIGLLEGIVGIYLINKATEQGDIGRKKSEVLIELLTSYCVRSWILGDKKNIPYLIQHISSCINSNTSNLYHDIYLMLTTADGRKWEGVPSNEKVIDKLMTKQWKNSQAHPMLILIESEMNLRCGDLKDMTVEHILPMKYETRRRNANKKLLIGNLTLVPQDLNSKYSNHDFSTKKYMKNGFNESTLKIDDYVKEQEQWGETEIIERTKLLTKAFCSCWPESVGVI